MIVYCRHRTTASGGPENLWYYDPITKDLHVVLSRGTPFAVPICATAKPRFGAFGLVQVDQGTWLVMPARYSARNPGLLVVEPTPINPQVASDPLALVAAPRHVDRELEALGGR